MNYFKFILCVVEEYYVFHGMSTKSEDNMRELVSDPECGFLAWISDS